MIAGEATVAMVPKGVRRTPSPAETRHSFSRRPSWAPGTDPVVSVDHKCAERKGPETLDRAGMQGEAVYHFVAGVSLTGARIPCRPIRQAGLAHAKRDSPESVSAQREHH